jgi:CBS domain-containing protein
MAIQYVTHLLVIEPASGEPTGMLSAFDVAAVVGGHDPRYARLPRPAPARPSSSARRLRDAVVADAMHAGVVACAPDSSLSLVAWTLASYRVHCVAVAGVASSSLLDHRLSWKLISDIDLMLALHRDGAAVAASTIPAGPPLALEETEPVERAAELMVEHGTRHLVAVGRNGLPVGILSTLDVARIIAASY